MEVTKQRVLPCTTSIHLHRCTTMVVLRQITHLIWPLSYMRLLRGTVHPPYHLYPFNNSTLTCNATCRIPRPCLRLRTGIIRGRCRLDHRLVDQYQMIFDASIVVQDSFGRWMSNDYISFRNSRDVRQALKVLRCEEPTCTCYSGWRQAACITVHVMY